MSDALNSRDMVSTPRGVAALLVRWALRSAGDVVLDPAPGIGNLLLECGRRLQRLGASGERIAHQLRGVDSRPEAASIVRDTFRAGGLAGDIQDLRAGAFLTTPPSMVDVLVGDLTVPHQGDTQIVRSAARSLPEAAACAHFNDPQCLLVGRAAAFLKPGGRMAVLLADGWLDKRYGAAFKDYLLRTFALRGVLGFQKAIFPQSPARLVALLAEKRTVPEAGATAQVPFVCYRAENPDDLPPELDLPLKGQSPEVDCTVMAADALKPRARWSAFLYAPDAYRALHAHPALAPLISLAHVRLGLQTFARRFYIVSLAELQRWRLERRWLMPLLLSPRQLDGPCLSSDASPRHYVLACREGKDQLAGTRLLRYIEYWENQPLAPRGRGRPVVGVQNLPGVARTGRRPWYNLLDDLTRRGTAPILLPRRLYRTLRVAWNQAGWVAAENFIEITPREGVHPQALLAVLNASVSELALRVNAQVHGGMYSLNPGSVGEVPVVDVRRLRPQDLGRMAEAYNQFVRLNGSESGRLDAAVFAAAGLPDSLFLNVQETLARMQNPVAGTARVSGNESGLTEELRLL